MCADRRSRIIAPEDAEIGVNSAALSIAVMAIAAFGGVWFAIQYLLYLRYGNAPDYARHKLVWDGASAVVAAVIAISLASTLSRRVRQAHRSRRTSEDHLEAMLAAATDGIWEWDTHSNRTYFSPRWKSMLGYRADELEDTYETWVNLLHPKDRDRAINEVNAAVRKGVSKFENEFRMRHKDGHYLNILSRALRSATPKGPAPFYIGSHIDVTDLKRAQSQLSDREALLSAATNSTNVGLALISADGRYDFANPAYERMSKAKHSLVGKTLEECVDADTFIVFKKYADRALAGESVRFELRMSPYDAAGDQRQFGVSIDPRLDSAGVPCGAVFAITDISAQKATEDALRRSEILLRSATETTGIGLALLDTEGRYVFTNPAYAATVAPGAVLYGKAMGAECSAECRTDCTHAIEQALAGKRNRFVRRRTDANGKARHLEFSTDPSFGADGAVTHVAVALRDISDDVVAKEELQNTAQRLQHALDASELGIWECNAATGAIALDARAQAMIGLGPAVALEDILAQVHPEDRAFVRSKIQYDRSALWSMPVEPHEYRLLLRDGSIRWIRSKWNVVADGTAPPDQAVRSYGTWQDITAERAQQDSLRLSEERLRLACAASTTGTYDMNLQTRKILLSPEIRDILGLPLEDITLDEILNYVHDEDRALAAKAASSISSIGTTGPARIVLRFIRGDGSVRWTYWSGRTEFSDTPAPRTPVRNIGVCMDVTNEYASRDALRISEERLRLACEAAKINLFDVNMESRRISFNDKIADWYGLEKPADLSFEDALQLVHPDDHQLVKAAFQAAADPNGNGRLELEVRVVNRSGEQNWQSWYGQTVFRDTPSGRVPVRCVSLSIDITAERESQAAVRRSEQQMKLAAKVAHLGMIDHNLVDGSFYVSPLLRQMAGLTADEPVTLEDWWTMFHPDEVADAQAHIQRALEIDGPGDYSIKRRLVRRDGSTRWLNVRGKTLFEGAGEDRHPVRSVYVYQDMTDDVLRETAAVEARRLEALGRLTGSIAHDSNNMLAVISGNLELLQKNPTWDRAQRYLGEALNAAKMGARLNKRLVTFAQTRRLNAAAVNLNDLVASLKRLLAPTLGELVSIRTEQLADPAMASVDATEVESAIVNLALNARDAMETGGTLTITTDNVKLDVAMTDRFGTLPAGDYIRVSIADTGCGMDDAVMSRVFEPFFTTKGQGRGSGLGLATVH
ncbi:MAG: PAS domain-containing protein, partial [Hyphomicrobium sp.]